MEFVPFALGKQAPAPQEKATSELLLCEHEAFHPDANLPLQAPHRLFVALGNAVGSAGG